MRPRGRAADYTCTLARISLRGKITFVMRQLGPPSSDSSHVSIPADLEACSEDFFLFDLHRSASIGVIRDGMRLRVYSRPGIFVIVPVHVRSARTGSPATGAAPEI